MFSCKKILSGLRSVLRIAPGYHVPPWMLVKLPMPVMTLRNWSGLNHATVKAQMPPLDTPAMQRSSGLALMVASLATSGSISSIRNVA